MFNAIVKLTPDNRVDTYMYFDTLAEAEAHVAKYGGFVWDNVNDVPAEDLLVVGGNVTVSPLPAPVPDLRTQVEKKVMDKMIIEAAKAPDASPAVKEEVARLITR